MDSPKRTAFSVLNTQRQLAKSLEAERLGTSPSDFTQRQARRPLNATGPVESSLQNKLLSEIPSLTSKRKASAISSDTPMEATRALISRLRQKARLALAKGDLKEVQASSHNYTLLTEELLRISAARHENESTRSDQKPKAIADRNELGTVTSVEQVELIPGEDGNPLAPLLVRTIRVERDKVMLSKSGGGIIKRAKIAPVDLESYCNISGETDGSSALSSDEMDISLLLAQLKKSPHSANDGDRLEGLDSLFSKLLN